jgi:hypothetical protein
MVFTLLRLESDKSRVFERVRWPDDQPVAWHLPRDVEDYCRQIVSEDRVRLASGRVRWVRRSKENHYLDCEAMQAAASHLLNVGRIREGARNAPAPPVAPGQQSNTIVENVGSRVNAGPREADDRGYYKPESICHSAFEQQQSSWIVPNGRRRPGWL